MNVKADCGGGLGDDGLGAFSLAFQPIVDIETGGIYAYEALVRGTAGEAARHVLAAIPRPLLSAFDRACRIKAIRLAALLGLDRRLHINISPSTMDQDDACVDATLAVARLAGMPPERITFEITEDEPVRDRAALIGSVARYRRSGMLSAIDDFGAGYAGLGLLAHFQPDVVKLDMELVRGIDGDRPRQMIAAAMVSLCRQLGIAVVAEGVETVPELLTLKAMGIRLLQGYLLARPAFEALPSVALIDGIH